MCRPSLFVVMFSLMSIMLQTKAGNTISDHCVLHRDGVTSDTDLYRTGEALVAFPTVAVVRKDAPAPI